MVCYNVIYASLLVTKLFENELVISREDLLRFLLSGLDDLIHDLVKTLLNSLLDAVILLYHRQALLLGHDSIVFVDLVKEYLRLILCKLVQAEAFCFQAAQG